jgi:hypothetical protein
MGDNCRLRSGFPLVLLSLIRSGCFSTDTTTAFYAGWLQWRYGCVGPVAKVECLDGEEQIDAHSARREIATACVFKNPMEMRLSPRHARGPLAAGNGATGCIAQLEQHSTYIACSGKREPGFKCVFFPRVQPRTLSRRNQQTDWVCDYNYAPHLTDPR